MRWTGWYQQGFDFVNAPFSYVYNATLGGCDVTGLWNSTHYQDSWYDCRPVNWTMSDIAVGVFMGVVPADRVTTMFAWMTTNGNEGPYGMRNVYPYFQFGPDPSKYGNGG